MNTNFYKASVQTVEGATFEAKTLGHHYGVVCREGVYYIYNCREV
jgi:hypothetical protein